ncbi:MAG: AMP-binding protein [Lautropia sp.]
MSPPAPSSTTRSAVPTPTPTPEGYTPLPAMIRERAREAPAATALVHGDARMDYATLEARADAIRAALTRDGVRRGERVAIVSANSIDFACVFVGALNGAFVAAPLAPSSTPDALIAMIEDADARVVFADATSAQALVRASGWPRLRESGRRFVRLGDDAATSPALACFTRLDDWSHPTADATTTAAVDREPSAAADASAAIEPSHPFNVIYSSGTTGTPKGIVQPHGMRFAQVQRARMNEYGPATISLLSTPLYSNTTLVVFFPTLALGGSVVLMEKFDARRYLELAERHRITHTMLVPVQYQRLMAHPDFDRFDLSSTRQKFCTSAPFGAALKRQVLDRWPGALTELYGMTEGGGSCILRADEFPDKLHTVGRPAPNNDVRLIDESGVEVAPGEAGEVVGRSGAMMLGYHERPQASADAEWFDPEGRRYIRTGDIGRFDADGFLTLFDRRKDMIITGGFNVYPSDIEAVVIGHDAVAEVAVVGVPSEQWGETPVAFVVLRHAADAAAAPSPDAQALRAWANERLGKIQRLAQVCIVDELPRSAIGKVLKRELRDGYAVSPGTAGTTPRQD